MSQTFDTPLFSSDQSIDRVLKTGMPVLLVFLEGSAPSGIEKVMKTIAQREAGKLLVVQMHLKDSPESARRYNIHTAPAVVAVKNGQAQSQAEAITGDDLERQASYLLGKGPRPEPKAQRATAGAYASAGAGGANTAPPPPPSATAAGGHAGQPVAVTDATFEQEVMRSALPVVVDFWAPWCGPCRMVAPVLDKLAGEWNGKVKIAKINVDENPLVAGRQGVQAIPTMLVVKGGKIVDRWAGALPEQAMRSRLSRAIA